MINKNIQFFWYDLFPAFGYSVSRNQDQVSYLVIDTCLGKFFEPLGHHGEEVKLRNASDFEIEYFNLNEVFKLYD